MSNFWGSLQYAPALCVLCALTRDDFYMQSSSPTKLPWKSGGAAKNSCGKVARQRRISMKSCGIEEMKQGRQLPALLRFKPLWLSDNNLLTAPDRDAGKCRIRTQAGA